MKNKKLCSISLFLLFSVSFRFAAAQNETITISTYYPAPIGVYNELRTNRLVIGDTNSTSTPSPTTPGVVRFRGLTNDPTGINDTQSGAIYYNRATNRFRYYNGSSWRNIGGNLERESFVIVQNFRDLNTGSGGVRVFCPPGFIRIACSGGLDWNSTQQSFWDSGDEEDKGYNGAAPIPGEGCTAFADGGANVYVWAYCIRVDN